MRVNFERITVDQGLSQSHVNHIIQDSKGFIWFGTNGGLNRFDGVEFSVFLHDQNKAGSISNNIINHIFEDKQGLLWISTQNGLNVYDYARDRFKRFKHNPSIPNSISANQVSGVVQDKHGNYWIGTRGGGLNRFDPVDSAFTVHEQPAAQGQATVSNNDITCLEIDRQGYIWIGTASAGVLRLDPESDKIVRYSTQGEDGRRLTGNMINTIYEDDEGDVWVGTNSGLNLLKAGTENTTGIRSVAHYLNAAQRPRFSDNNVLSVYQGMSGLIWFGTNNAGLGYLSKETGHMHFYEVDPSSDHSLLSNKINTLLDDKSGILWIGTNSGINLIDLMSDRFQFYKRENGAGNTLSSSNVQAIYKEANGNLWIGTYDKGLNKYSALSGLYTTYLENDLIENGESLIQRARILRKFNRKINDDTKSKIKFLSQNRVLALLKDRKNNLWIGTGGGLDRLNLRTGTIKHYNAATKEPGELGGNVISCLYEDSAGMLWIGTHDAGLFSFNGTSFSAYQHNPDDMGTLSNNDVRAIVEDGQGNIWVATFGGGINQLNTQRNRFRRYEHIEDQPNSLSSNSVYSLHVQNDNLWIGTADGLNRMHMAKEIFDLFTVSDGLPSNFIYSILADNQAHLWLGTNKGLSRLNTDTFQFRNYDRTDGLQGNEFNPGSAFKASDGTMYFGGINGYNTFLPELIDDNTYIPDLVITEFRIMNEKVVAGTRGSPLKRHISETDTITLSYRDKAISFEFVALNYTDPEKNEYAYKMEGFESDWNFVGNRRFANYTNLPHGEYTFRVIGSNNDGIWNEEGTSIKIFIKPAFWNTSWFYFIVIGFSLTCVYLAIQLRTRNLQRTKVRLEDQVRSRTVQLLRQKSEVEKAHAEITLQKEKIEKQRDMLMQRNEEITAAKSELDEKNEELKAINVNLESIVAERTQSLQSINEELKKAIEELDLFIYRASHDLKGPIARLLGLTLVAKMDSQSHSEYIDIIETGAIDMNRILNKLINIHLINKEVINMQAVDMPMIIEEARVHLARYIDMKSLKIELKKKGTKSVVTDAALFRIIMENIMENALMFKKSKNAQLTITCHSLGDGLHLCCHDNGMGIAKDQIGRIFEMFYRGSDRSRGNGLGLYLVKKAVEKLQGNITVSSEEGEFTEVNIFLPHTITSPAAQPNPFIAAP